MNSIETLFETCEHELSNLKKTQTLIGSTLKRAEMHCKVGDIKALQKSIDQLNQLIQQLSPINAALTELFKTNTIQNTTADLLGAEVETLARSRGVSGLRYLDDTIFAFPVITTVSETDFSVNINRKRIKSFRPSHILAEIQLERSRSVANRNSGRAFLDQLERIYLRITLNNRHLSVPMPEIYKDLTPLKGQSQQYSTLDFAIDLHRLVRSGDVITTTGARLSLPASTGSREKHAVRLILDDGEERVFSSVRFD